MSKKYKVISTDEVVKPTRKSPVTLIIEDVGDGYLTIKDLSKRYDVHPETIRRLIKAEKNGKPLVNAPSEAVQQGGLLVYLFNRKDVAELDAYMESKGHQIVNLK